MSCPHLLPPILHQRRRCQIAQSRFQGNDLSATLVAQTWSTSGQIWPHSRRGCTKSAKCIGRFQAQAWPNIRPTNRRMWAGLDRDFETAFGPSFAEIGAISTLESARDWQKCRPAFREVPRPSSRAEMDDQHVCSTRQGKHLPPFALTLPATFGKLVGKAK